MRLLRLFIVGPLVLAGTVCHAATHLLLVAADRYPGLSATRQLPAVRNDVALVRPVLTRYLQPASTIELSGRAEAQGRPEFADIRAALVRMLNVAHSGDWVVAYFAGHGTQIPAALVSDNIEADGLDEVFLAADVRQWDKSKSTLPGALSDNAIHDWWQALQRRNVSVWLIFDTCHAGDMAKGMRIDMERRVRRIPPGELGVPSTPVSVISGRAVANRQPKGIYAPVAAFYAARSNETTTEEPIRLPDGTVRGQGIFTYALVRALESSPPGDLEQLAAAILARYRTENRLFPNPAFEGPLRSVRPWAKSSHISP